MKTYTLHPVRLFLFALLLLGPLQLLAHAPDHSYLYMRVLNDGISGRIEITSVDLNRSIGLNLPERMTLEQLRAELPKIEAYLRANTAFSANGVNFPIRFTEVEVLNVDEIAEPYAVLQYELEGLEGNIPENLDIRYAGFSDTQPIHRGLLIIEYNWKAGVVNNQTMVSHIFGKSEPTTQLSLSDRSVWRGFVALVKLGVWHIWIGLDHILFIVALILPAVVRRRNDDVDTMAVDTNVPASYSNTWWPVAHFGPAFWYIIKIITFFTIAHSITLALAALEVINLPSRFVESIIAISIALAALHNITPIFRSREWLIAFLFGLFHGFGFASVLGEKGLGGDFMVLSLCGFNGGGEVGQVLIICMVFPFLFFLRKLNLYPRLVTYGSVGLIFISIYWFVERAFEVDLPLGQLIRGIIS